MSGWYCWLNFVSKIFWNEMKTIAFFLFMTVSLSVMAQKDYYDLAEEADKAIKEHRWSDAEMVITEALEAAPDNPSNVWLLSNLGIVRFNLGQDSLALETLNEAHRKAPSSVVVLENRAKVYRSMGRDKDAYNDYSRIIALDSTMLEPRFLHCMIAINFLDLANAQIDIETIERIAPDSEELAIARASMYQTTGQLNLAVEQYSILIERAPSAVYYGGRAACLLMLEKYGDAAEDIAAGLKLDESDAELYLYRAYLHKRRYHYRDAENDKRKAISLGADPQRAEALLK